VSEKIAGKEEIAEYFEGLLEKHGDHYLSLDWNSKESQLVRFSVLLDIISFAQKKDDFSILDVGCGIGHFYEFLQETNLLDALKIDYSGIDISGKMIDFSKKKYPKIDFRVIDLISDKFDKTYDYLACSGIFNVRMADIASHKETVKKMLSRMYHLSDHGVSANFLAQSSLYLVPEGETPETSKYVFFAEEEVISWVKAISESYIVRHDYHPGDFTVYMLK